MVAVLDCGLFAAVTAWMILPLFTLKYMDRWISMESLCIGGARFLAEQCPHPPWQPGWYAGARFDYRYATALTTIIFHLLPAQAYHRCCALFYCLGSCGPGIGSSPVYIGLTAGS